MRRIISVLAVMAVVAAMVAVMAMPAFAAPPQGLTNFGQCASTEATFFPPGPAKGQDQSLARGFNPSGTNLQCPVGD